MRNSLTSHGGRIVGLGEGDATVVAVGEGNSRLEVELLTTIMLLLLLGAGVLAEAMELLGTTNVDAGKAKLVVLERAKALLLLDGTGGAEELDSSTALEETRI